MRQWVIGVVILVGKDGIGGFARKFLRHLVIRTRVFRRDCRGCDNHLRPVGAQEQDLFIAHLIWHDEDGLVALECRGDCQPHPCIAAGCLDDRPAWLQLAALFCLLNDVCPHAIFHRPAWIHKFQFCV